MDVILSDLEKRQELSSLGRRIVDGKGINRILSAMTGYGAEGLKGNLDFGEMRFKHFTKLLNEEKLMVLEWRNRDEIRKWMFNQDPIEEAEHLKFIDSLEQDDRNFYRLVFQNASPVAVIYLNDCDYLTKMARIGIYSTKRGAGSAALSCLKHLWFRIMGMEELVAEYKEGNEKARNLYSAAGFSNEEEISVTIDGKEIKAVKMTAKA